MSEATEQLRLVIPCHNEEANPRPLVVAIRAAVELRQRENWYRPFN